MLYHGFEDVLSARVGGAYALDVGANQLVVRGGIAYDTAAAPKSWSRLDIDGSERYQIAAGASYDAGSWRVDLGGAAILSPERTVEGGDPFAENVPQTPQESREQPDPSSPLKPTSAQDVHPFNNGTFQSGYLVLATGVTFLW